MCSRSLNVGEARMGLKDDDIPDVVRCWRRSLIFYSKPLHELIKASAASDIKSPVFLLFSEPRLLQQNVQERTTPAFESFISRNKCLFILRSLRLCNLFCCCLIRFSCGVVRGQGWASWLSSEGPVWSPSTPAPLVYCVCGSEINLR